MSDRAIWRRAMTQDLGTFKKLWMEFLEDQYKKGGLVLPNKHNIDRAAEQFRAYVSGDVLGIVLFLNVNGEDVGVHMGGEMLGGLEFSIGRYTMLWGVYYRPEHKGKGYTHLLYQVMAEWLKKHGINGTVTSVLTGNATVTEVIAKVVDGKFGADNSKPYAVNLYWEFEEPS